MDTRGSITQFGPVKLVKKATSPTGSITQDANPEGVNQYTGGAGKKGSPAQAATMKAIGLSAKADAASSRAAQGDKESRGYGTTNGGRHSDAAAMHSQAASAHSAAAKLHDSENRPKAAEASRKMAETHSRIAANHEKRMNP